MVEEARECYLNPTTYFEIINACTDAQAIDKLVDLSPMSLSADGGFQPLPWRASGGACSSRRVARGYTRLLCAEVTRGYTRSNVNDALSALIRGRSVVALTGAGVSTESGIPDYRSPAALGKRRAALIQGPEFVRSEAVRRRYWARSALGWEAMRRAEPNAGHRALAAMERAGRRRPRDYAERGPAPQQGGSRKVTELHGALAEVACCVPQGARRPRRAPG